MQLVISRQYQQYLREIGIDIKELLTSSGIERELVDGEVAMSLLECYQFIWGFDQQIDEDTIRQLSGLSDMVLSVPTYFAMSIAPDGLTALERFCGFQPLVSPNKILITERAGLVEVRVAAPFKGLPLSKFAILNTQLFLAQLIRKGTDKRICPVLVSSPYPYELETTAIFGVEPRLERDNLLVFSKKDLSQHFTKENDVIWRYLEPELQKKLKIVRDAYAFTHQVQAEILAGVRENRLSMEEVASRLQYSSRTVQRKLRKEKTSYQEQLQLVQKTLAFIQLEQGDSAEEISNLLGYSEATAFSRAFKKWTGQTVSDFRKYTD